MEGGFARNVFASVVAAAAVALRIALIDVPHILL